MPLMLIIYFLFSAMIIFEVTVYMNEKQQVADQEQVLMLDWLLRNGEREWIETKSDLWMEEDEGVFHYPNGKVTYQSRYQNKDRLIVQLRATHSEGHQRTYAFYVDVMRESIENEEEETLLKE